MDRELAQMVAMTALRAGIELGNLVPLLKEHGEYDKDEAVRMAIGSAVYETGLILARVFEQHPGLEGEIDARRRKYGRSHY